MSYGILRPYGKLFLMNEFPSIVIPTYFSFIQMPIIDETLVYFAS